jgi:hypothetical protein
MTPTEIVPLQAFASLAEGFFYCKVKKNRALTQEQLYTCHVRPCDEATLQALRFASAVHRADEPTRKGRFLFFQGGKIMGHRTLFLTALFLAVALVLIVSTSSTLGAAISNPTRGSRTAAPFDEPANPGQTHIALQGSMWEPQNYKHFSLWQPMGWGTIARIKPTKPADQWVHIGLPLLTFLNGTPQKVNYVEFCAQSSFGAQTKPVAMTIWDNNNSIGTKSFAWPADNGYHCVGYDFGTNTVWRSTLGLSVRLHFASASDTITLYKAWVKLTD